MLIIAEGYPFDDDFAEAGLMKNLPKTEE